MGFSSRLMLSITRLNRFSKSPRNCVPAIRLPRSSEKIFASLNGSGTFSSSISRARPYVIAVLPTPGSPIWRGLFFSLRHRICIVRSSSSSLPIRGFTPSSASLRQTANCCHTFSGKASDAASSASAACPSSSRYASFVCLTAAASSCKTVICCKSSACSIPCNCM